MAHEAGEGEWKSQPGGTPLVSVEVCGVGRYGVQVQSRNTCGGSDVERLPLRHGSGA